MRNSVIFDTVPRPSCKPVGSYSEGAGKKVERCAVAKKRFVNTPPLLEKRKCLSVDLPIAIGLLEASSQVLLENTGDYIIAGELSLDGKVKRVKGMLSMAICARDKNIKGMIVPLENAREAAVAEGVAVYPVGNLTEALEFLQRKRAIDPYKTDLDSLFNQARKYAIDFKDVKGQEHIKRALLVAAAGGHNMMMCL